MSIITGVTELSPRMTVLQAVAWVAYVAAVIPAFLRAGAAAPDKKAAPPKEVERERASLGPRRRWALGGGLQETMFGRRRDSGGPLDGTVETDIPNYAADPKGDVIGSSMLSA